MKKTFLTAALVFLVSSAFTQKLFTYGKYSVDAKEFLRAYNKPNRLPLLA